MALIFPLYLAVPLVSPPRGFVPPWPPGEMLLQERALDAATCAFPSFHVVWALVAADAWGVRFPLREARRGAGPAHRRELRHHGHARPRRRCGGPGRLRARGAPSRHWARSRRGTEGVANSWREDPRGTAADHQPRGLAALATFGGVTALGAMVDSDIRLLDPVRAAAALVGSALWAQTVEGSPSLSRPYGFYGGLLGIVAVGLAGPLLGTPTWLLLGANTVVGPWVQATGRMRCLVQGCCHGHEAPASVGIRYAHPRSRVVRLSTLGGVPVHPTPLYSILWNVVTAVVLVREAGVACADALRRRCVPDAQRPGALRGRRPTAASRRRRSSRGCACTSGWRPRSVIVVPGECPGTERAGTAARIEPRQRAGGARRGARSRGRAGFRLPRLPGAVLAAGVVARGAGTTFSVTSAARRWSPCGGSRAIPGARTGEVRAHEPGGSVKDRLAKAIIDDAEARGCCFQG